MTLTINQEKRFRSERGRIDNYLKNADAYKELADTVSYYRYVQKRTGRKADELEELEASIDAILVKLGVKV